MLLGIPAISYYVSKTQTKIPTKAAKSTNLSFVLPPDQITPGKTFNLDIQLDPGSNQVSFVRLVISYNPQKLAPASSNPLTKNDSLFAVLLEGPTTGQCTGNTCTMTIAMGISPDSGKPIQGTPAIVGTARFNALQATDTGPTIVAFATGTQVLSLAAQDAPSENVLASAQQASISIVAPSITPSPTSGATTPTPAPTTIIPTPSGTTGITPTPTLPAGGIPGTISTTLTCSSFTANPTNGSPPLPVTFTVVGVESSTSATISKATVNFGDGNVQDITTGGGIGTQSVNTQISHTYQAAGTFTTNATLTDSSGGISNPSLCQQTITVGAGLSPTSGQGTGPTVVPTLMKTGPGQTIVGVGIAGGIITVLGAALLFGL